MDFSVEQLRRLLIESFGDPPLELLRVIARSVLVSMETLMELRLSSYFVSIRLCSILNTRSLSIAIY